jgi:hypothetical protein
MQHPDEGTIHSWLDGALSADEAARVEAHVKDCPECAAAVAEARGFIAASSRILTALDNAPRGVIPATAPKKRFDPMMWRIAATAMVVAVGTLAVVRSRGGDERPMSISADRAPLLPHASNSVSEQVTAATGSAASSPAAAAPDATPPAATARATTAPAAATRSETVPRTASGRAPATTLLKQEGAGNQRADIDMRDLAAGTTVPAAQQRSAVSDYAGALAVPGARSRAAGVVAMDAAVEPEPLKVVGNPRAIGMKITLYEVAPGDTVTLREPATLHLEQVVVTGAAMAPTERRTAERFAAPPSKARANAANAAAPDSQRAAEVAAAQAPALARSVPAPSAPAPVTQVEVANGVTTISWTDATAGNVLRLSGRMPEARLREIKIRIERERAAARRNR